MDPLSDLLRVVRLDGAFFYPVEAIAPWGVESAAARELAPRILPNAEHLISYHILIEGRCFAGVLGEEQVELAPGDVIVFPHGDANLMSSAPGLRVMPGVSTAAPARYPAAVHIGANGPVGASFVCGFLGCDRLPFNPLLGALPRQLHVRGMSGAWVDTFARRITEESRLERPGADTVLTRLAELMFIEVLRRYLEGLPQGQTGWLAGVRDDTVGRVLALLHARPEHPWTLDELAREASLVPIQRGQAVRRAGGAAADAVPHRVADAGGGQSAGADRCQGVDGRRRGGLRLRGRVQPGLQESHGARAGGVAGTASAVTLG